jgi:bifunctional non-homologous end joining protein LigD
MRRGEGDRAQWLLIKHRDENADSAYDVTAEVMTSVASGRTMEEIASRNGRVWNSNRADDDQAGPKKKSAAKKKSARKAH